jgi:U3 small nucleolar ribonucleoprotein protein LCP5
MAATTLAQLLSTLTDSIKSATSSLPDSAALLPPADGISLLNTKNELLLAYLQNLAFLIILKLRNEHIQSTTGIEKPANKPTDQIHQRVVEKLVELRIYLEKGVKPLESRLRYQIDQVVRAADESAARAAHAIITPRKRSKTTTNGKIHDRNGEDSSSSSIGSDSEPDPAAAPHIDDLAYRPNPSALVRPSNPALGGAAAATKHGIYRPPRITPTALSTTPQSAVKSARKSMKSATLEEFISTELSEAPYAEPSIGSTIADHGRRNRNAKERKEERERDVYEESNYVRLPKEGRKKGPKRARDQGWAGEEWRDLGEGADRVVGLTRKGSGGALERSRKRSREDGGVAGPEVRMGERFEKRRKREGKGRKK